MVTVLDLPDDVLQLIFHDACAAYVEIWYDFLRWRDPRPQRPPHHVLSSVCSRWHHIVQTRASLWTSIYVFFNTQTIESRWAFIKNSVSEALAKSRDAPITLRVWGTGYEVHPERAENNSLRGIMTLLAEHSSRWKYFRWDMQGINLSPDAFLPTSLPLPILEELHLACSADSDTDVPDAFKHVPRLMRLTAINVAKIDLSCSQLKTITLSCKNVDNISSISRQLHNYPLLESIQCLWVTSTHPTDLVLSHPNVRDLSVPSSDWLDQAYLPSLQTLNCQRIPQLQDLAFLERSKCALVSLVIENLTVPRKKSFLPFAPLFRALRHLTMRCHIHDIEDFIENILVPVADMDVLPVLETVTVTVYPTVIRLGTVRQDAPSISDEPWTSKVLMAYREFVLSHHHLSLLRLTFHAAKDQAGVEETKAFRDLKDCERLRRGFKLETKILLI
ncbi:hypothetical protein CYLTODRAFT_427278 [Cylindrobasidium torrendii FP15055 ss-10]|uniref:Uncharacterized protein n=1 Tax=Cylindrobasidium torrendii FP15055 ss-10 TaxID=1314674 RepID=A0A0D7AXB1_9AGAR|nr:hypothetical protein CYLTODRAFT_427278 [Cylindrobasidium torrendii FP15055 ss-10]